MSIKAMIYVMIGLSLSMGITAHFVGKDMDRIRAEQAAKEQAAQQQQQQAAAQAQTQAQDPDALAAAQAQAQAQSQSTTPLPSTEMSDAADDPVGQAQETAAAIEAQQAQADDMATADPASP